MLRSKRRVDLPQLGATVETVALLDEHLRLHLVRNRGVICEDDLVLQAMARKGAVARPVLTVVLAGRARVRFGTGPTQWLSPGDVIALPRKELVSMRQEGTSFASLALEWDEDFAGARPAYAFGRLAPASFERIEVLVGVLRGEGPVVTVRERMAFEALLAVFRAEGFPFVPATDLPPLVAPDPGAVALSGALDGLLSRLDGRPMAVDLDRVLGFHPRKVTREVTAFNQRYGFNAEGWRDAVVRRRLTVGAAMMTAVGAVTEQVSAALGYSSPTAFCRALSLAGLPSPGRIRETVDLLL